MNCPYCNLQFHFALVNKLDIPKDFAPVVCEGCGEVSALIGGLAGQTRKMTERELGFLRESPAWRDCIAPAQAIIFRNKRAAKAMNN